MNVREATEADRPELRELVAAYLDEHWARPLPAASAAGPVPRRGPDRRRRGGRRDRRPGRRASCGTASATSASSTCKPEARGTGWGQRARSASCRAFPRPRRRARLAERRAPERRGARLLAPPRLHGLPALAAHRPRLARAAARRRRSVTVHGLDPRPDRRPERRREGRRPLGPARRALAEDRGLGAAERVDRRLRRGRRAREPEHLRKLASELSYVTGGVVIALGIEQSDVVRLVAFERGRIDGRVPLRPGVLRRAAARRRDGAPREPDAAGAADRREAASDPRRGARRPRRAPSSRRPTSSLAGLAEALGIEGAGLGFDEATASKARSRSSTTVNVVLLHAFPLDERMWEPQLAALADHEVVAPNLYELGGNSIDGWAERDPRARSRATSSPSARRWAATSRSRWRAARRSACAALLLAGLARDRRSARAPGAARRDDPASSAKRASRAGTATSRRAGPPTARPTSSSAAIEALRDRRTRPTVVAALREAARLRRRRPGRAPSRSTRRARSPSPRPTAGSRSSKARATSSASSARRASTRFCASSCSRRADRHVLLREQLPQHLGVRRRLRDLAAADAAAVVVVEERRTPARPAAASSRSGSTHSASSSSE